MTKTQIIDYLNEKIEDYNKRIERDEMCIKMQGNTEEEKKQFESHKLHLIYACNLAYDIVDKLK